MKQDKLNALADFLNTNTHGVCFLEGQTGSFKTELVKEALSKTSDKMLVFKFKCFEGSTLDDIYLAFFEDLKKYSQQKKITLKKIDTNSISQRINSYLTSINLPCAIVIDSLENIFSKKYSAEKEEFCRYIEHLNKMHRFKIILISTSFATVKFELENSVTIQTEPFSKEEIRDYFLQENITTDDDTLENIYDITRGNQNYITTTAGIITTLNTTPQAIVLDFTRRHLLFEDFINQKLTTFVPDNVKKSLYILSVFNEGISPKYLTQNGFFSEEQLAYMVEKGILAQEYGVVFLKNSLKKYLQSSVAHFEKIKYHTMWRDFYESQLPLKPNERAMLISRDTMRAQIEYHSSFIIKTKPNETPQADMSLVSYLNSNLTAWNIKNTNAGDDDNNDKNSKRHKRPKKPESLIKKENNQRFEKYALTKEEISLLSVPVDMSKTPEAQAKEKLNRTFEQKEEELKRSKEQHTVKELFNTAQELENQHELETAFIVYAKALAIRDDGDFYEYEPKLLEKLAICARKMNKTTDAIDFYNKLTDLYSSRNEIEKMNEIRLEIAQIYKEIYKMNHARVIYENFINKKSPASDSILARSYIELAGIEEDLSNTDKAIEYFKKAFVLINEGIEIKPSVLAQAYFKYALILDDFNRRQPALDFYQKSIRTDKENNIYLSAAYTNIAEILKESGSLNKAEDYFKLGLKTDFERSNYEGMYYICLKLSQLYETLAPQKVLAFLLKSLSSAKRTREALYITNAYIELGDYYMTKHQDAKAFKALLLAKKNISADESSESIDLRINDLKARMDKDLTDKITDEVNQHE